MSYMGPRFGGQIFPQQNQPFQQSAQRQYQMMQMQLQLQQKIQSQLQKQYAIKTEAQQNNNKPILNNQPGNKNMAGPTPKIPVTAPGQNQSNSNQKPPVQQNKPMNPPANQRNMNNAENKNQNQQGPNKGKGPELTTNKPNSNAAGIKQEAKDTPAKDKPTSNASNDKGQPPKNKPPYSNNVKGPQSQNTQNSLLGQHPSEQSGPGSKQDAARNERSNQYSGQNQRGGPQGQYNQYNNQNQNQNQNQGQGSWQGGQGQGKFQGQGQNQGSGNFQQQQQQQQNFNRGNPGKGPSNAPRNAQDLKPLMSQNLSKFGKNAGQSSNDYRQGPSNRGGLGGQGQSTIKNPKAYFGMEKIKDKVKYAFTEPLVDLPEIEIAEKKFNAYAKLFIGNIPKNCEQKEIVTLFEKYGEIGPVYLNKESSFGFIHMDYKASAAKAMKELDNTSIKNRYLKVRFATINEGLRVKNLSPYASNELLEKCFSVFGPIESCRVVVDDRYNPKAEGIVIFKDKKSALVALKKCQDDCYFLSGALRPVVVTALEPSEDNVEGYPESLLPKNDEYISERNVAPHFADRASFEFEFGMQWKQLFAMYEEKKTTLDRDFQIELERLEKKMVLAKVEYETDKLRKELAQREAESAELRRHFDYNDMGGAQPSGPSSGGYDSYSGSKRALDQGYDSSFNGPYDAPYNDGYDRGTYSSADYDRGYDQGGYGSYSREDYLREGAGASGPVSGGGPSAGGPGYGHDGGNYDNTYDRSNDMGLPERSAFDSPAEGYSSNAPDPASTGDLYPGPNKRPRY